MVKLRNNQTGEVIEKSEVNWNNLQKDLKAKYTVLDGAETSEGKGTLHFTPPELIENKEPAAPVAEPENSNEPETGAKAPEGETQEQQIVRLYKEANPQTPKDIKTAISAIAKEVGAHFKSVEKVVNASA